ncbi:hypothetical protein BaRGS_00037993, partial [Batillaria attramentaria]
IIPKQRFIKFTAGQGWNNAKAVCANNGGHLATVDSYSTSYLRRAFAENTFLNNDNTWIGLHDAEPEFNSLGANGFVWDTCIPLSPGAWTNWAQDEPAQRYNNWCVRMSLGELQWQPEQCTSSAHFLCQQNLGPCGAFKNSTAGCDTASLSYMFVALSVQLTWDECLRRCMFYSNGSDSCWMFKYEADAARCSLAVGAEPVYCADSGSSSTSGSSYWVRQCYSLTYDQTHTFNVQPNYDAFPVDYCGAMTTMISTDNPTTTPPEETTTSAPSDTTTLVSTSIQANATTSEGSTSSAIADTATAAATTASSAPEDTTAPPARPVNVTTSVVSSNSSHTTEAGVPDKGATPGVSDKGATTGAPEKRTTVTQPTAGASAAITSQGVTSAGDAGITNQTTVKSDPQYCDCVCKSEAPPPSVDPAEVTQQIVQELSVDKRHLSSTRRKLTCAIDNRPTAKATGGLGAVLLLGFAGLVILPDLRAIYMHVRHGVFPEDYHTA